MKYRLHNRLGSGGFVIQSALTAAEIEFEYEPINSTPGTPIGKQIQGLNGWGQVPVLELQDGTRLTEVAATLAYLSYTEPQLRNGPELWIENLPLFLRWSVFLSVNAYEGILRCSYTERYFSRHSEEPNASEIATSIRKSAQERVHAAFKHIESETSHHSFLLGDRLSACDIYLAMLYAWHNQKLHAWHNQKPDLPKCTEITTRVATHPIIGPIWEQNFHDRLDFKWHAL